MTPQEVRRHRFQSEEVERLKAKVEEAFNFVIAEFEGRTEKGNLNPIHLFFESGELCIREIEPIYRDSVPEFTIRFRKKSKGCKISVHETLEEETFLKTLEKRFNKEDGYEAEFLNSGLKQIERRYPSGTYYSVYGELIVYINILDSSTI